MILLLTAFDLKPFQGYVAGVRFPGLKPRAECLSPFGAKDLPEHSLT